MGKADLHLHTTASDGRLTPAALVKLAAEKGLQVISITDHDTIDAYREAVPAAREAGIGLLYGVEITTDFKGQECHILGYNFDENDEELARVLASNRYLRVGRARRIVKNLNKQGIEIDYDEVRAESGTALISRNHIAQILIDKRYAATFQEVFTQLIGSNNLAYENTEYPSAEHVIDVIRKAGGTAVLAHPKKTYSYTDLKFFMDAGMGGIEYMHPSHPYPVQCKLKEYALNYGLKLTGGSDFHGIRKSEYELIGKVAVDTATVADLLAEVELYE